MTDRMRYELKGQSGGGGGIADLNIHYFEKGSKELKLSRSLYLCHVQHIKFSSLEISWSLFVTVQDYWILDK